MVAYLRALPDPARPVGRFFEYISQLRNDFGIADLRIEEDGRLFRHGFDDILFIGGYEAQGIFLSGNQSGQFLRQFVRRPGTADKAGGMIAQTALLALAQLFERAVVFPIPRDQRSRLGGNTLPIVKSLLEIPIFQVAGIADDPIFA